MADSHHPYIFTDFSSHIAHTYSSLSPSARDIADFLQRYPTAVVTMSLAQIAEQVNTSKASVSRFFRQLGYQSHLHARTAILNQREVGLPIASLTSENITQQELRHLDETFKQIEEEQINRIAQTVLQAKRVVVFGARTSYPIAMTLCQQLKQVRSDVILLPNPGQSLSEDLVDMQHEDVIIIIGFRRRPKVFKTLLDSLPSCHTVLFTDPSGQLYRPFVNELIVCQLGQTQAFDSYAAPMAVVSLLCNNVYKLSSDLEKARSHIISRLYNELDELS